MLRELLQENVVSAVYVLEPITRIASDKKIFKWTEVQQKSFQERKNMMAKNKELLHYPNFKLDFDVYTNASDYQLEAAIIQENGPVAFYSRKLTPVQINYTVMENELLSIIETCVHF